MDMIATEQGLRRRIGASMPVRKIIKMGHPTFRQRAKSLQKRDLTKTRFKNLLSDMVDTLEITAGWVWLRPKSMRAFGL